MKKLDVLLDADKKKWDVFIRELEFKCTNDFMGEISDSTIQMHEFNCGSKLINIHSSPYISQLKYTGNTNNTFFIFNSISSLSYSGGGNHAFSQNGSSVFLPSVNKFNIESKTRRRSLSLFLNRSNIASSDDYYILNQFLWGKSDRLDSESIINDTIQKLYHPYSDLFLEKTFSIVSHLVSYEIEKIKINKKK